MEFKSLFISEEQPYKGKSHRDNYLSRVFGIFSEEIIRIWCNNPNSHFTNLGRPTIYTDNGKYYTLDFLLRDNKNKLYVGEMKCEIAYNRYKYLTLDTAAQLKHHKNMAFQVFLALAKHPECYRVKTNGTEISVHGTALIWGRTTQQGEQEVKDAYGISHILSTETIIENLILWNDNNYLDLVAKYKAWSNELFDGLAR